MPRYDLFTGEKVEIRALLVLLPTVNGGHSPRSAPENPAIRANGRGGPASGRTDIRWMVSLGCVWLLIGKVRISAFEWRIERARARALCADRTRSFARGAVCENLHGRTYGGDVGCTVGLWGGACTWSVSKRFYRPHAPFPTRSKSLNGAQISLLYTT